MRAVVLTLFLAFVAGERLVPHFNDRDTYVYKYEARIMGGLPEEGLARAGLKLSSKVLISAEGQNVYILKLAEVELFQYSGIWPKGSFSKAAQLTSVMTAQLTIPIKFEYTDGIVGKMFVPEGISKLTINIFKGILNVLQLNIKKTQNVYELQEAGTQGVCKTFYTVTEHEENPELVHLTKTRDMNQCQERIIKDMGSVYTERYDRKQESIQQNLKGATSYRYILRREQDSVMIKEVTVNELIEFSALSEPKGAAQMETKQSLAFQELQPGKISPSQGQYHPIESLKYEFSYEHLQTPVQLFKIHNVPEQVKKTLEHLVSHNMESVHEDAPLKFLELIQLLRVARYEDLEMIWHQKKTTLARYWIMDAIPVIGNKYTLKFIKEKFQADEITVTEAVQALVASIHMVTADREVITLVEDLTKLEKIRNSPVLREVSLLGYGTMVYKYCAEKEACPEELLKPIHDRLKSASEQEEIILLLKTLGNAGHPSSLKPITKALPIHGTPGASLPFQVHAEAIMALRNIAKREPRMVQPLAVQLYMDKTLHPELRMLACIVLFETRPQMALVLTIATGLKTEKNLQVASFTYSHMKSLTRSIAPIHYSVAAACNVAVKIVGPKLERLSLRFSRAMHVDTYNYPLMLGAAASAFYINDAATILPRSVVAKTSAYFTGIAADIIEVGARTEGLQEVFMRSPELLENTDRITKMKRALRALSHLRTLPSSKPLASIYLKFFGQEIAFAQIDKTVIDKALAFASGSTLRELGKALLSHSPFHITKSLLVSEVRRFMPTAAGLPLELSLYTAAVAAANIEVKATSTEQLPENFQLSDILKSDIQLEAKIKPSVAVNTFVAMGVNTEFLQAGLMLRAKLSAVVPSHLRARLDFTQYDFKVEALPVTVPENLGELQVETFAVVRNIEEPESEKITPMIIAHYPRSSRRDTSSRATSSSKSSEVLPQDQDDTKTSIDIKVTQSSKKYCKATLAGLKACIKMSTEKTILSKDKLLYTLLGKHSAAVSVKQTEVEIEKLMMELQFGPKAAEKLIKRISMDEEEIVETQPALRKLKKILSPLNQTSSSESSSSSQSSSGSSSSSSSSSSGSKKSSSSSSSGSSSSGSKKSSSSSSSNYSKPTSAKFIKKSIRSSSASSLSSLISSSSSSSQSSAQGTNKQKTYSRFQRNHQKSRVQADALVMSGSSSSSGSSFQVIYKQKKFLGQDHAPVAALIFHAVRSDKRPQGQQIAVYLDKETARLQIVIAALEPDNSWRLYADGVVLSHNKVTAQITWGANGRQYDAMMTAETGSVDSHPAARVRLSWRNLPSAVRRYVKKMRKSCAPMKMLSDLMRKTDKSIIKKLSAAFVITSEKTLDFIWKTSSTYQMSVHLPVTLPIEEIRNVRSVSDLSENIHQLFAKAVSSQCVLQDNSLKTFNGKKLATKDWPLTCSQVLSGDSSNKMRFLVLRAQEVPGVERFTVKVANIDVDVIVHGQNLILKINGEEPRDLPHKYEDGILVERSPSAVFVRASKYGLAEVFVSAQGIKITLSDEMKGKLFGICGSADEEVRQEYRSPNRRLSSNRVSYAHSWTLPAQSCQENTECRLTHESVQMRKQVNLNGRESQCYSIEPVLRCLPGCFPVKTTFVTVGYHCTSDGSIPNMSSIYEHDEHLKDQAEAHLACSCSSQCA